jgi:serine protease Do
MIRLSKSAGLGKFACPVAFGRFAMRPIRFGILALAVLIAPATSWTPLTTAADVTATTSASAVATLSQGLRRIIDGSLESGTPLAISDLRAMQGHVRSLSEQLKKCTVGVRVDQERGNGMMTSAWGSGVIISKDGYVLTAAHVAGQPNQPCKFTMNDGREINGKTLGMFRTLDAGLLKITEPGDYPFAELGDSNKVKTGNWCIALGHPGGFQEDRGLVLRLGQVKNVVESTDVLDNQAITTDCTLVGGDSGGPLFDLQGRVIGINSRIGENYSTNMHVPVNAFHDRGAWERMLKGDAWGHLPGQRPWLGVGQDESSKEAKIATVGPGSPAEKYGLKAGDVVLTFDGRPIADFSALRKAVDECHPNEWVRLRVRRESGEYEVGLRLGKKPE